MRVRKRSRFGGAFKAQLKTEVSEGTSFVLAPRSGFGTACRLTCLCNRKTAVAVQIVSNLAFGRYRSLIASVSFSMPASPLTRCRIYVRPATAST